MSFQFRLERVLRYRRRQVDARSLEVAAAEQVVRRAEQAAQSARDEIEQHQRAASAARLGSPSPTTLSQAASWRAHLAVVLKSREDECVAAREALTAAQARLQQAWRDREALVRLRQRQREDWRREDARREQQELDEVGSIRAALGVGAGIPDGAGDEIVSGGKRPS